MGAFVMSGFLLATYRDTPFREVMFEFGYPNLAAVKDTGCQCAVHPGRCEDLGEVRQRTGTFLEASMRTR